MTNEVDNVRNVLCDWYIAMKNHDIDKLAAALSDTFLLIEHDELMDGKHLIEMLASEDDSTLVANLHDFHITVSAAGWIGTAYILANAIFVPIGGKLGDTIGRKRVYITGFVIFIVASALAGFAVRIGRRVLVC